MGSRRAADPVHSRDALRRDHVADRQDNLGPSPHHAEPAFARGLVELTGVALRGDAGASGLLAFVMKGTSGRVLIVDDEPHVRGVLRDFLTTVGDEVTPCAGLASPCP